jgi:hypothetical protein
MHTIAQPELRFSDFAPMVLAKLAAKAILPQPVAKLHKRNKPQANIKSCHYGNWATTGCPIAAMQ